MMKVELDIPDQIAEFLEHFDLDVKKWCEYTSRTPSDGEPVKRPRTVVTSRENLKRKNELLA